MSICPECGEEIDYLYNVESGDLEYRFNPDGSYEGGEFAAYGRKNEYGCPKCRKLLFTNETDAKEFLKGEMFVVVNLTKPITCSINKGEFYVMGEEARTFGSIADAAQLVAEAIKENGHTTESACVFKLVPVSQRYINKAVTAEQEREKEEAAQ